MRRIAAVICAGVLVAACTGRTDDRPDDVGETNAPATGADAPAPAEQPAPAAGVAADSADDAPEDRRENAAEDQPADASGELEGDVAVSIPARFHGEWNADRAACGTGASETRLRIGADRLRFYESTAVVREVAIESDRVITVTAEYQGEGDTWQEDRRLRLSEDGSRLTVSTGRSELVRYRCP